MKYTLSKQTLQKALQTAGFSSARSFCKQCGVHRNTLGKYLKGQSVFANGFERIARKLEIDPMKLMEARSESEVCIADLDEIRAIIADLAQHDQGIAIILIGSRARGKAGAHADWDIGITRMEESIGGREYLALRSTVEDAAEELAHAVDLINLDAAPGWFLKGLEEKLVFLDGNRNSFIHFQGVLDGIRKENAA